MAKASSIEWTNMTWNPVTGCSKVSQGCKNCYAERMAKRLKAMGGVRYKDGFTLTMHDDLIDLPRTWKRPRLIFVNSMSDLFHENVAQEFIHAVFQTMNQCPHHVFQVLTKRSARLLELAPDLTWTANIWMGVSVENSKVKWRIDHLRQIGAKVKFLSLEPLIGPLHDLDLHGIDWTIVGGESGPGARLMRPEWVRDIREQCIRQDVAFFFKQWGGVLKSRTGRELDGRTWDDYPIAPMGHPAFRHTVATSF